MDSARLSPAEMPAIAVSTNASATSRPSRRSANSKTVSSACGGAEAAHGSRKRRSLAFQLMAVEVSSAGSESGTCDSTPWR